MKNDDLIRAFGDISNEMIEAANRTPPARNRINVRKIVLVAALISLLVISVIGVGIWRAGTRKLLPDIPEDTAITVESTDTGTGEPTADTTADTETDAPVSGKKPVDDVDMTTETPSSTTAPPDETKRPAQAGSTSGTGRSTTAPAATEKRTPETTTGVDDRKQTTPAVTDNKETERPVTTEKTDPVDTTEPTTETSTESTTETDKPTETDPIDPGPEPDKSLFADVKVTDESYRSIKYVVVQGYMSGRTEDLFEPEEYLTRAEFIQSLYKIAGSPQMTGYYKSNKCFYDTALNAWYYDAVLWSKSNMILNGEIYNGPNDRFYPDSPVTRADAASAMLRMCNYFGIELIESDPAAEFDDTDRIPVIARNAVKTLANAGVITAKSGNLFEPDSGITRAEAATMIETLMDRSKIRSVGLLEKYGLTLTYGAQYWQYKSDEESQKIVVSLKQTGNDPIPELKVEGDIKGCECAVYGVDFTKKYSDNYANESFGYLNQFVYFVKRSHEYLNSVCGYFYDGEILTVTLKISVGEESTTVTIYPNVVSYN